MKAFKLLFALLLLGTAMPVITACEEEGTFEQMGENIDETGDEISDSIEDATDN